MGFLRTFEAEVPESYRQYYLKYAQLKERVTELATLQSRTRTRLVSADLMDVNEQPVGRFQALLQEELKKVNQFACVKHEALYVGLRRLCEDCKKLGKRASPEERPAELQRMSELIEGMSQEIVHLDTYVRLNYLGFQKLTRKFDQCLGVSGSALFLGGLHAEPFCNVRFDDILILLGLAWARWRAASASAEQEKDATWKPPESFIRNTAKYWVRPDKVVLLKTRILKELPYLIFGASMVEQEKLLEPFALLDLDYAGIDEKSHLTDTLEESQLLSSVYFDSPDGTCYYERIRREEGARLVRFRWYGENNLEDDKEIYVERKIHHEGWGSASSAKERCILSQRDIFDYMKGHFDIEGHFAKLEADGVFSAKSRQSMKGICHEVNSMIQEKKLQPILRTSYYRCAFQLSTSNEVRVSLDTQMSLLNEYMEGGHPNSPWCHIASDVLHKEEVYRFPFAILEVKLQNVSETPLWLRQTLADIEATQVHKFSKFQHGMAFLHPDKVSMLPHWHQDFYEWHQAQVQGQLPRSRGVSNTSSDSVELATVPKLRAMVAPTGEGHMLKDMKDLDPKAVFANERTLLHYAEKGLYSGALAVALLHLPGLQLAGVLLAVATGLYLLWALQEYYLRLGRITGRAAVAKDKFGLRLDLAHGPLIVVSLIGFVLLLSMTRLAAGAPGHGADP
mmetsp:Transcript_76774/g.225400  ORF Transcript_76774/g.225400 Transcript_76774/m.225400 type:complete len:679 (+) Transcript_76774:84-2120(+)